jgi:hypothetical protein
VLRSAATGDELFAVVCLGFNCAADDVNNNRLIMWTPVAREFWREVSDDDHRTVNI